MRRWLGKFRDDRRGVAAIEAALLTGVFTMAVLNTVDVGKYAFVFMETRAATQAGALAAIKACDVGKVPATVNCPGLSAAVTAAVQGSSLGSAVQLQGALVEAYYCLDGTELLFVGDLDNKPADCSEVGHADALPVLYMRVSTTYAYTPLFGDVSVAAAFPTPITTTAWMRMI